MSEPTDEEVEAATELKQYVDAVLEKYRPVVNQTPELLSILYDVDLLPEQLLHVLEHNPPAAGPNASRMAMICELYARAARPRPQTPSVDGRKKVRRPRCNLTGKAKPTKPKEPTNDGS